MKRIYRNCISDSTREKQSLAHKGRRHSESTKQKISRSLSNYWAQLPYSPNNNKSTNEKIYGE